MKEKIRKKGFLNRLLASLTAICIIFMGLPGTTAMAEESQWKSVKIIIGESHKMTIYSDGAGTFDQLQYHALTCPVRTDMGCIDLRQNEWVYNDGHKYPYTEHETRELRCTCSRGGKVQIFVCDMGSTARADHGSGNEGLENCKYCGTALSAQSFKPTGTPQIINYIEMTNNHNGTVQFDELPSFESTTMNDRTVYASDLAWAYESSFSTEPVFSYNDTYLANPYEFLAWNGSIPLTSGNPISIDNVEYNNDNTPRIVVIALTPYLTSTEGNPWCFGWQVFTLPTKVIYNLNEGTAGTGFETNDWVVPGEAWLTKNGVVNHTIAPKKTGNVFDGWYTDATGGTKVTTTTEADAAATSPTSGTGCRSVTLYAHWKAHTHSWQYNATSNKLEAYCANADCPSGTNVDNKVSLTLTASSANYSGSETYSASFSDTSAWTGAGLSVPTIKYYKATAEGGTEGTEEVTNLAGLAAGNYYAAVTAGEATAKAAFKVIPVLTWGDIKEDFKGIYAYKNIETSGWWIVNDACFKNSYQDYEYNVTDSSVVTITEFGYYMVPTDNYLNVPFEIKDGVPVLYDSYDFVKINDDDFLNASVLGDFTLNEDGYNATIYDKDSVIKVEVVGNNLKVTVENDKGHVFDDDSFKYAIKDGNEYYIPSAYGSSLYAKVENNNMKLYYANSELSPILPDHTHHWTYKVDGATLKAYCSEADGASACSYQGTETDLSKAVSLTLSASSANYSGSSATIYVGSATEREAWESAGLVIPSTIYYETADGTTLGSAPTAVGSYVAKITVGEQTAQVSFTIQQNHGEDTSKYAADDSHHWRPCLRTDCDQGDKYNESAHSYDSDTHKCVCGKIDPKYHQHLFATAWSTDAAYHWHECTAEGSSEACLIETGAAKKPHDSWNDGKCGICGYECQHNDATSGVCGICTKDLDSGSTPKPNPTPGGDHSNAENAAAPTIPTDYVAERVAEEEAMEVSPVTIDVTQYSKNEETVVPGTSYNLSKFITTKGIVKGIKTAVAAANKDKKDTIEIYTGKPFCFNKEIIKTIQESKKTVVYYFHYKGHIYSVTVPATVDASKVLEKAGFAGPLYVGKVLGTTKLVK